MKTHPKSLTLAALLALLAGESFAAGSHTTPCYFNGKTLNVDSGCTLEVKSGGVLQLPAVPLRTTSRRQPLLTLPCPEDGLAFQAPCQFRRQTLLPRRLSITCPTSTRPSQFITAQPGIVSTLPQAESISLLVRPTCLQAKSMMFMRSMYAGTPTLCSMYWGGNTSRSSSAAGKSGTGDARIVQLNGVWVNKTALAATDCFGRAAGTTGVAAGANQATLLGSYYTSARAKPRSNVTLRLLPAEPLSACI